MEDIEDVGSYDMDDDFIDDEGVVSEEGPGDGEEERWARAGGRGARRVKEVAGSSRGPSQAAIGVGGSAAGGDMAMPDALTAPTSLQGPALNPAVAAAGIDGEAGGRGSAWNLAGLSPLQTQVCGPLFSHIPSRKHCTPRAPSYKLFISVG